MTINSSLAISVSRDGGNTMRELTRYESILDIPHDEVSSNSFMSSKCCIFKTPNILSRQNEKAYIPNAFSFGPLHHGKPNLKATQKIKFQYFSGLLYRKPTPSTNIKDLTKAIEEIEGEARQCYIVSVDYSKKDFVDMLVLDGCFIIELVRKDAKKKERNDPVFSMACMLQLLNHDLILLENQIPWFVLDRLFELTSEPTNTEPLTKLVIEFFSSNLSMTPSLPMVHTNHGSKHILDLLRNTMVLNSIHKKGERYGIRKLLIPTVTSLKEAGIIFKMGRSNNILNINFKNGVLEMPSLLIHETTNDVFRNLISFEQCYPNSTANITSYARLLDNLINTPKDISILQEEGIIDNWLNQQDAVDFFNKLYHDTYVKEFYYLDLCKEINIYCNGCWPRARAAYVRNHFNGLWGIVSQLVGGIILVLTVLQTVYTIKGQSVVVVPS